MTVQSDRGIATNNNNCTTNPKQVGKGLPRLFCSVQWVEPVDHGGEPEAGGSLV